MNIEVRPTEEKPKSTIERVARIDSGTLEQVKADFPDHNWEPASVEAFLADSSNILILAKSAERVSGILTGHRLARLDDKKATVLLYEIDVHPDFRKQGIASEMINSLKEEARSSGASEVWVITNKSNGAATALYENTGGVAKNDDDVVFEYPLEN
jgi:ribosomal protein S18 acetylase RimI-like enzyme